MNKTQTRQKARD